MRAGDEFLVAALTVSPLALRHHADDMRYLWLIATATGPGLSVASQDRRRRERIQRVLLADAWRIIAGNDRSPCVLSLSKG